MTQAGWHGTGAAQPACVSLGNPMRTRLTFGYLPETGLASLGSGSSAWAGAEVAAVGVPAMDT